MNDDPNGTSCRNFQDQLAELIGSGSDIQCHPHLQSCVPCRALVHDLGTIAEGMSQLDFENDLPWDEHPDFGEDGDQKLGVPAILPKIPGQGRGSATAPLDAPEN